MHSVLPFNYHAPWHDLRWTCVGSTYAPDFYEPINNSLVRDSLQRIAYETQQDLDHLRKVLEQLEITVTTVPLDPNYTIMDFVDAQGRLSYASCQSFTLIPRSPMQPRDSVLIVGDRLLRTQGEGRWIDSMLNGHAVETSHRVFDAPLVTVVGNRLIVDSRDHAWLPDYLSQLFPTHHVVPVTIGGHNDAVYAVLAPGVIVSSYHHTNYADSFPGWTVKYIENQSWNAIPAWRRFKHSNQQRWWVPEDVNNPDFADFVNTWLTNWLGHVNETVFDVNMLQINPRCVLVNNYNDELFAFLKQHQIEPIIVPFRHRFFWDGGLHCVTNDLYREGTLENYF